MRVRKSTADEKAKQLKILRTNLPRNMAAYEHIDIAVAKRRSREQLERLLDDPRANKFFTVVERDAVVGYLWLIEQEDVLFVAYLYVLSAFRRQGYGEKIVHWIESHAAKRGAKRIALHVFPGNVVAVRLYEKCGFISANLRMLKPLDLDAELPRSRREGT